MAAVSPGPAVARCLERRGKRLVLREASGSEWTHHGSIRIVAMGKAAAEMAEATIHVAADDLESALVVVPEGGRLPTGPRVRGLHASHPLPTAASLSAGEAVLAAARTVPPGALFVVLLSGGASALVAAPTPGLTIEDKRAVTAELLASGAPIDVVNLVRRHCSRSKGGGLLRAAAGAEQVWTLALSDVVGDDPAAIASGPTVADPSTYRDAIDAIGRWAPAAPGRVRAALATGVAGRWPETLKPDDPLLERAAFVIVGSNRLAVEGASVAAVRAGYRVERVEGPIVGDATAAGEALARRIVTARSDGMPTALVAGGEPTVRVVAGGHGGRAQQLALAAAPGLAGSACLVLAAGTDGIDGPTDAAGAWVDGATMADASRLGLDVGAALAGTNAYPVLSQLGALVRTGLTGTNVADVVVALRAC